MEAIMRRLASLLVASCLCALSFAQTFNPAAFTLPSPPVLSGPLSPNYALYNSEKLHNGRIQGPTSYAFLMGNVYTVTSDRKVVNIAPCQPRVIVDLTQPGCNSIQTCGLLTSIRVDNVGMLLVLDAYRGLYRVNPMTGATEQLYSSQIPVGNERPRYLNGMVQIPDGTIFMSDSSDKYDAVNDIYIIMEGATSGRILALNPTTRVASVFMNDFAAYPNGLEVTSDGTRLLVAESGRARIISIGITVQTLRQMAEFSSNLPGLPGNIRRSSRGTYWVGLSNVRHAGISNSMDMYSNNVEARRRTVYRVPANTIRSYYPSYGLVVELDANGRVIGSLHDPTGRAYNSVSEAAENEGLLYIASPNTRYAGRIVLPQGDGRVVTIDSVIQVLRSRCQIAENRLAQAKAVLTEYINRQTQSQQPATQPPQQQQTTAAPVQPVTSPQTGPL